MSELTEWAGTRRLGRTWFLWKHCFPIFVLIPVLASVLDCFLRGRWQPWYVYVCNFCFWLVMGFIIGWLRWKNSEAEFKAAGFKDEPWFDRLD